MSLKSAANARAATMYNEVLSNQQADVCDITRNEAFSLDLFPKHR